MDQEHNESADQNAQTPNVTAKAAAIDQWAQQHVAKQNPLNRWAAQHLRKVKSSKQLLSDTPNPPRTMQADVSFSQERLQMTQDRPELWMGLSLKFQPLIGEFLQKRGMAYRWKQRKLTLVKMKREGWDKKGSNDPADYILLRRLCPRDSTFSSSRAPAKEILLSKIDAGSLGRWGKDGNKWQFNELNGRLHVFKSGTPEMAKQWCKVIKAVIAPAVSTSRGSFKLAWPTAAEVIAQAKTEAKSVAP
jgi:hypothetical protein